MASERATRMLDRYEDLGQTEDLVYRPNGGPPRTIACLVERRQPEDRVGASTPLIEVTALNDELLGMDPKTLDRGGDQVDVAERYGGTRASRHVRRILAQDNDWVTVEVS